VVGGIHAVFIHDDFAPAGPMQRLGVSILTKSI
jgi:hypothetical protein